VLLAHTARVPDGTPLNVRQRHEMATKANIDRQIAAQFFIAQVLEAWRSLDPESRTPKIWLREHDPFDLEETEIRIDSPVIAAWLIEDGEVEQRDVSEFVRFYAMQADRLWSSAQNPPVSPIFGRGVHEFGLSAFAPIVGTSRYYFEWQFAACHGRGTRFSVSPSGELSASENLWIS
jgi:hypothetical protein